MFCLEQDNYGRNILYIRLLDGKVHKTFKNLFTANNVIIFTDNFGNPQKIPLEEISVISQIP